MTAASLTRPTTVFAVFTVAYLLTWGGHLATGDGTVKLAWATALVDRQSADIDPGPDIEYSKYGVGHSLAAVPSVLASRVVQRLGGPRVEAPLYMLLFIFNGALWLALAAAYLRRHHHPRAVLVTLGLLGFGTIWWPYTKLDFTEPLVLTTLFGGFLLVRTGRPSAGIAVAALAGLFKPEAFAAVAIIVGWWAWVARPTGRQWRAVSGLVPAIAIHLATVVVRGTSLSGGYSGEVFSTPLVVGLYGSLFSAGKSVFLFSPPLLLGVMAARKFSETREGLQDLICFALIFVTQILIYAAWWDWSGDDAWGPRFLIPGTMLLCLPAVALSNRHIMVALTLSAGIAVQMLAVLPSPLNYVLLVRERQMPRARLFDAGENRVDFEDVRFNPRYTQLAGHWILMRHMVGWPPSAAPGDERRAGTPLAATLPAEVWASRARADILWIRLLRDRSPAAGATGE